jgi:hypothetical protein
VTIHGLAPFTELVEALGGRHHLWIARPAAQSGCREHPDDVACGADEYVPRIVDRMRYLAEHTWPVQRNEVLDWVRVLEAALRGKGSAALAFAILPRLTE